MRIRFLTFFTLLGVILFMVSCGDTTSTVSGKDVLKEEEVLAEQCQDGKDNDEDGKTDCEDEGCKGYVFCLPDVKTENTAIDCNDAKDNDEDGKTDCDDDDCKGFVFCASKVENTAVLCQDSLDTDDDGKVDCEDEDCQGFTFCATTEENTAIVCQDNRDNDGDGKIDCEDEDCQGFTFCESKVENTAALCNDHQDNDDDGKTDCEDEDCQVFSFCVAGEENTSTACNDHADNDNDSLVDCDDPDCQGFTFCVTAPKVENTAALCRDGDDNDNDLATDCDDPDCQGFTFCQPLLENTAVKCQDGNDNDNDGKVDCDDEDCQGFTFCATPVENTAVLCQDTLDNDNDGKVDCDDEDCQGFTFCATPVENTAVLCQDTLDNDNDGKVDCDDEDCQGFTFCGTFNTEDSSEKCQDGEDNDDDGKIDCDDENCWQFSFCNVYNGSPVTDSWGDTWDSLERGKKTWTEAKDICESLGGRLPTVTELYRNNANLTGDLGESYQVNYLWSVISFYTNNQKIIVRLSDGNRTNSNMTDKRPFRCIWPNDDNNGFNSKKCYGEPGNECFKSENYYNIDNYNRPPLPYASALNECNFYGASLMILDEYQDAIHKGLPNGKNEWNWVHQYYGGNLIGIRWTDNNQENWSYINGTYGSYLGINTYYNFRCIGIEDSKSYSYAQSNPVCYGGCFENSRRVSSIKSDSEDRDAENFASAIETCRNLGGQIPNLRELSDNIHSGWDNGSNSYLWLNNIYSNKIVAGRWNGLGNDYLNTNVTNTSPTSSYKVRCVWHKKKPDLPACNNTTDVLKWVNGNFVCETGVNGTSGGNAYNSDEKIDPWGNAWDGVQRPGQYYEDAKADCEAMGGRLPTATELYRVNATTPVVANESIGTTGQTGYLWTTIKTYENNKNIAMKISDGTTQRADTRNTSTSYKRPYRCIWPVSQSDILYGSNCNGEPGSECFSNDNLVIDSYDRVALDYASAINDCIASGGHIPDMSEYAELIHSGLLNGSDSWLWVSEALYSSSLEVIKWNGTGSATWPNSTNRISNASYSGNHKFRCVYRKILK